MSAIIWIGVIAAVVLFAWKIAATKPEPETPAPKEVERIRWAAQHLAGTTYRYDGESPGIGISELRGWLYEHAEAKAKAIAAEQTP